MGTDIKSSEILKRKDEILDAILQGVKDWDGSIDTGIELMNENQDRLEMIKEINKELYSIEGEFVDQENYYEKINAIVQELKKMNEAMKRARKIIIEEKRILDKKDNLIDSYITNKKDSIFIDKDV